MSSVSLRFLGCGDAFSSGGRLQTCLWLDGGEEPVMIDCGATALAALKQAGLPPRSLRWLALSHLHGDHFGGIPWLLMDGRFSDRTESLTISGPPSTRERLRSAMDALYPGVADGSDRYELAFLSYEEAVPLTLGPAVVTPYEVDHPSGAPAFALRVQYAGRTIAFSGDTQWTDSLLEVARDADVFVCECNDFEPTAPGHLDIETLRVRRSQLGCKRLVLTHLGPQMIARLDEVEQETARDGLVIEL